jgi:chorismate synthase
MISHFGNNLKLSIFGTSHGPEIGMTLEGIPAGLPVDMEKLQHFLNRRAPGKTEWSTPRKEADIPHFQSGLTGGITDGQAIRAVIYNENVRKTDYDALKNIPRPGHADYAAWMKYGLDFDMSGGGPFSGRMTAPLCIAGGLCKQWLEQRGIRIGAHILYISTGTHCDMEFDALSPELDDIDPDFPTLLPEVGAEIQASLAALKADGDSAGGYIECAVTGLPAGIGGPLFGGVESHLAQIVYGIPAVKALEFGNSEGCVDMVGSLYNDEYLISDGKVVFDSNSAGGILGGITTGMPLIFRVGFKPTPSIAKPQRSVNLKTMEEVTIEIKGRHDPCIVPRAVPVVEAAAAIAIYDLILGESQ